MTNWTDERAALAKKRWIEGRSASEIARELGGGFSRNAVIGKIHRLGLSGREQAAKPPTVRTVRPPRPVRAPKPPKPTPPENFVPTVTPAEAEARRKVAAAEGQKRVDAFAEAANDTAIPLIERGRFQCSWPVGEPERPARQMCCGAPVIEGANKAVETYCTRHAKLATTGRPLAVIKEASDRRRPGRVPPGPVSLRILAVEDLAA
ncbi:GcrA family cell cycle regulator [Brevundimonas sp. GCM10030266]|uniref:GcrA family cell cycle regulator n=1 Tax=Brevundimonas sp. GCM10030266 TaxID=3273386 RepID=UPI00360D2EC6